MNMPKTDDAIGQAIAAAQQPEGQKATAQMRMATGMLATGKPIQIAIPADFTALDALCATRFILDLFDQVARERPASRLVLPRA